MKRLSPKGIKILKTVHIIMIMMWTVGVICMTLLLLMDVNTGDELYAKYKAVRFIDDALVISTAIFTVVVGILYGLVTNWGFFKHRWITVKWIVSIIVIVVGTFYLSPMLDDNLWMADKTRDLALNNEAFLKQQQKILYCGSISSLTLISLVVISVFKPWRNKKESIKN